MRALKNDLWEPIQISRLRAAPALSVPAPTDALEDLYPPLVRWYVTLLHACAPARAVLLAMFRRHEIENLKLLWRSAVRGRALPSHCWRPLAPLDSLKPMRASSPAGLVELLKTTAYGHLAAETWRSHGSDLVAAELAMDAWVLSNLHDAAVGLPDREAPARDLLFALLRERDLDILRRARDGYRLEPSFAVGLTTRLRREHRREALVALAVWQPSRGALVSVLPASLVHRYGEVKDWDDLMAALDRVRTAECRRLLMAWPFQIAPSIAALILREDQMRIWASLANAECGVLNAESMNDRCSPKSALSTPHSAFEVRRA
jgi:hypothetical protein